MTQYPAEILGEYDDDGSMVNSKEELAEAVVGHKIVKVEHGNSLSDGFGNYMGKALVLTLDNGKKAIMTGIADCCAYTELKSFLLNPELVDHIITGVGTTDGYDTWHIYADMGDVLKLNVEWSCGNPFYYAYGFNIKVVDA